MLERKCPSCGKSMKAIAVVFACLPPVGCGSTDKVSVKLLDDIESIL